MTKYYTSDQARWIHSSNNWAMSHQPCRYPGYIPPRQNKAAFVLGRFQPLHDEHVKLIKGALEIADKVLVVIGSANEVISIKNPFPFADRKMLVEKTFKDEVASGRLEVQGIEDTLYRDGTFYLRLERLVSEWDESAVFYSFRKDKDTCDYIDRISFKKVYHEGVEPETNATLIRTQYLSGVDPSWIKNINVITQDYLHRYKQVPEYRELVQELAAVKKYNESFSALPFPPHFVAVDGLVTWRGHILLIERKSEFGNGKWALPGGYLDVNETLLESAKREVREETNFVIDGEGTFLTKVIVIDAPTRSMRGRMITHVHVWRCCEEAQPTLTAGDDAAQAFWLPMEEVYKNKTKFFSDHYYIIAKIHPEVEGY